LDIIINVRVRHFFYINLEQIKRTTCPIKFTPFSYERKNTVLQWALKLNSALAATKTWDLWGCMVRIINGCGLA
jgi:hypothetical protein